MAKAKAPVNYFKVLDLDENCRSEDVKKSYFSLAKKWHPDVNKSEEAAARFKLISDAYTELKDDSKRAVHRNRITYNTQVFENGNISVDKSIYTHIYKKNREKAYQDSSKRSFSRISFFRPSLLMLFPLVGVVGYLTVESIGNKPKVESSHFSKSAKGSNTVEAWFNPRSKRWETPAPWDDAYRRATKNLPNQQVDREKVHLSSRSTAAR